MYFKFEKRMLIIIQKNVKAQSYMYFTVIWKKNIEDTLKLFMWKTGKCLPFFFICKKKKYSNARYIVFIKLFAMVELSFVDTHYYTQLWGL